MNSVVEAMRVAKIAHGDQLRKFTDEPYLTHPYAVAGLVSSVSVSTDMIAAAFLHDVVEDTSVNIEAILTGFGDRVASLVDDLTDVAVPSDGNRVVRVKINREHTARASVDAKTIKLADLIDNTKSIVAFDPKFAEIYMAEKKLLLEVLTEGDSQLYNTAVRIVERYYEEGN